jgi:hypothetical protein
MATKITFVNDNGDRLWNSATCYKPGTILALFNSAKRYQVVVVGNHRPHLMRIDDNSFTCITSDEYGGLLFRELKAELKVVV